MYMLEIGGSMQYRVLISYNCNMLEAMYRSRCKLISKFTTDDDCNVYMKQAIMELHLTLDSFLQQRSIIDVRCVSMCPSTLYSVLKLAKIWHNMIDYSYFCSKVLRMY